MSDGMNVTNKMVSAANSQLEKTDRLEGHTSVEKMTDQAAGEALSKTETTEVFKDFTARPLPKIPPKNKPLPQPSAEQIKNRADRFDNAERLGNDMVRLGQGQISVDDDSGTFVPMPSLKQFEKDSVAFRSPMGSIEKKGALLAANFVELGQRIQTVAGNIFGEAKKIYGQIKSAAQSQPQSVPSEVKSDFGKNLYRALSDGSLNTLSREGIGSKIDKIKDETERKVLHNLLDQQIPDASNESVESKESVGDEPQETPALAIPKQLSSAIGAEMGRKILDGSYEGLEGIEKAKAEALLSDLEKQVIKEMLSDKEMTSVAAMPKELTKMEATPGFVGFKCEVDGNLSRAQIRELADKHLNNPNKKERSDALFLFQRDGDSKDAKLTIVMRDGDRNSPKADKIDTYDDDIRYNPNQFNYNEVDSEQIFLKFE